MDDFKVIGYDDRTKDKISKHEKKDIINIDKKKKLNWKYIVFPVIGVLLVSGIIAIILSCIPKTPVQNDNPTNQVVENNDTSVLGPLEMQLEYKINTNVNDLKRIYINQRYYEDIKKNGILSHNLVDRKTNYDIYIISEIEADEETKLFYNKTYFCSISIASECVSTNDEYCLPKKLVDLIDQDYSHIRNLRTLNEGDDLKEFPLPLCFFNITDNNVITSIACHEKITKSRINSIVLDLYFFRPPGIKRINKEEGNITIYSYKEGDKEIVREINGGICDIDNSIGSFCTTDMKTTKDSKGNLLKYEEIAFTNVTTNEDHYYIKNKTTTLLDKTEFVMNLSAEKYNETLFKLYPQLKNYLNTSVHFSTEDFKELYRVSKGIPSKDENKRRNLVIKRSAIVSKEQLFNYSHHSGLEIDINLQINAGLNTEAMEASNLITIGDEEKQIASLKQISDIDKTLNNFISLIKAGNHLATDLYKNIKDIMNNITEIVKIKIPSMTNLIAYKELSDIFDSTFSLNNIETIPNEIIEESNILIYKLENIYNGIENGSLKNNITILNDYIYIFIKQSHKLINEISNNLKDLEGLIKRPKQAISDISNYYMNHTSTSYTDTIIDAKNILMNYFINEKDLILKEIENILDKFENKTIESIQKQINLVNILNQRIENNSLVIKDANEEKVNTIINNLYNSNNYIKKIMNLFKDKIRKEMGLKDGYFISQYDIELNNQTFSKIIEDALNTAKNLDENEYVDKKFDEIMTIFRNEFTSIIKYMNQLKEEKFPLVENALNGRYFLKSDIDTLSRELKDLRGTIINKIKNENNVYLDEIRKKVNEFLQNNLENLNNIIYELNKELSEVKLGIIDNSYKIAFGGYLRSINDTINYNKDLAYNYLNELTEVMKDNKTLLKFFNSSVNQSLPSGLSCLNENHDHCWKYKSFVDSIASKYKTQHYSTKYNIFKANFEYSKEFIEEELRTNIKQEYKSMINNIKETLQSFKNNKMSDKYPELKDLYFIDNHIKQLDTFYINLNKYISDDKFNQYYLPQIKKYENEKSNDINNIKKYIEEKHKIISPGDTENDYKNDFCTTYNRKKTYTCKNGDFYYYTDSGKLCFISPYTDNYKKLILPSFETDTNFKKEFENYSSLIRNKINTYNKIISDFKKSLIDIESQVLSQDITHEYLFSIQEKINSIISEKYSDNLIIASYNYYKILLNSTLQNVLNEVSNRWINSFNILEQNINNNLGAFKNSISEFSILAQIYNSIISQNITSGYFDSIINHQKSEFNYTISYYYNCLIQNITSTYQYIINQIPNNEEGFNNILDLRKTEVENKFNDLFNLVKQSKEESLSLEKQLHVLQVSQQNFFKVNSIMTTAKNEISTTLSDKYNTIKNITSGKQNNEYSLACRFYLENSLNGWQIENYYEAINENIFIDLHLEQFKNILSNNWIFDKEDFINKLNISLYNINLKIINDYNSQKEDYENNLEREISGSYSKDKILKMIDDQYKSQIKEINEEMANIIKSNIMEILELIKTHLKNEEKRLKEEAISYSSNFKIINKTIQTLKDNIIDKLREKIKIILNDFYNNMFNRAYSRFETNLNDYLESAKKFSNITETYNTLKSSFNIGDDIYEIVNNLVSDYKNFTQMQINLKNDEYIEKKYKEAKIDEINKLINDELDPILLSLLNVLDDVSIDNDNVGNDEYDLSNIIKNEINSKINETIENINNLLQEIKGDKYYVDLIHWQILDFERVDVFENIKKKFESFIKGRINDENREINKFLKEIIRKNFNTLINNLLLSFGTEFFERILKYNENFKITTLYQNLKYSSVVSLQYYAFLYALKKRINSLTQDLKIKLYNLNNLDFIAQEKNQKVLDLLDDKIDDFIKKSKQQILNDYTSYLKNDALIKKSFNELIIENININLKDISPELEKDFSSLLNELKKQFKDKFTKVMNSQANDMILTTNELKEKIKSIIDDLFSLDIEEVLQETNKKMNITIDSIKNYTTHFNSFKFPEALISFLDNYGDSVVRRAYDGLETLINKETKNITMTHLNRRSQNYENILTLEEFLEIKNNIYSSIKNDNIFIIKKHINSYGLENYLNVLNKQINKINSRRTRRLEDRETEEDINEEFIEKAVDKPIDENFNKLMNISENSIKVMKTEESFDKFEEIIEKSIKKLNVSYKETQQIIANIYQDDDMFETLNIKLDDLYNYSINYYEILRDNFNSLKTYIEDSLLEIKILINKCANITYKTFEDKYEEIASDSESVDKEHNEELDSETFKAISSNQNGEFETIAEFKALKKKGRFKFSLIKEGEGKMKKLRIVASVVNQIKPDSMKIKVSQHFGACGEDYYEIKAEFKDINYSSNINFDTKQAVIKVNTIANFEKYRYSIGRYKIENSEGTICYNFLGTVTCIEEECDMNNPKETAIPEYYYHQKVYEEDIFPIET